MDKICSKYTENKQGQEVLSNLYLDLEESKINGRKLSGEDVDAIYNEIYSPTSSFKDWFGDWTKDNFPEYKIDENGEPKVKEVREWASKNMSRFADNNLSKKIGDIILNIERQIGVINNRVATKGSEEEINTKQALRKLKDLKEQLSSAKELEAIESYINDGLRISYGAGDKLKAVESKLQKGEEITKDDISTIVNTNSFMQSYSSMLDIRRFLPKDNNKLYYKTVQLADNIDAINDKYLNVGIPILADYLLEYLPENINAETQAVIDNIKENNRDVRRWVNKSSEYKKLQKRRKSGDLTAEQFRQEVNFLTTNYVKNNKLVNRESLINWLKSSAKDKSQFSVLFDPIIYSSDITLQLFAKSLKSQLFKAETRSRDVLLKLNPAFNEFRKGNQTLTSAELNKDLYETVSISVLNTQTGKYEKKNVLSFIQDRDINKFKEAERNAFKDAKLKAEEVLKNTYGKDITILKEKDSLNAWYNTEQGGYYNKIYGEAISDWYKKNTEAIEGAFEKGEEVRKNSTLLKNKINKLKNKTEELSVKAQLELENLELELEDVQKWLDNNYVYRNKNNIQYRGSLVKPNNNFINPKYQKIQSNPRLKKYYDTLLNQFKEDQKKLPSDSLQTNKWEDFSYIVPSVRITDQDRMLEQNLKKNLTELKEDFKIQATDTQYGVINQEGKELKQIPIFYTNLVDESDVTKDLVFAVAKFNQMAEEYKAKYEIQSEVNLMNDVLENRETAVTNSQGETVFDALAKRVGIDKFIKKQGESSNFQHFKEFVDMVFYGKTKIKQEIAGIDVNKVTDKLIGYTARNSLALNVLQGVSNITVGEAVVKQEAYSGKYFNRKELAKASLEYTKQLGAIQDYDKGAASTSLGQMIEIFDPLQGEFRDNFSTKISGSRLKKMLSLDKLMFIQQLGEHELQVRTMIAMMLHQKVKLKDGSETNLYDAVKKNAPNSNGIITAKFIIDSLQDFSMQDLMNFRDRVQGVNGKLHGKYNEFDKASIKRRAEGRLLMLFRGFLVPGIRRRYGHGDGLHLDSEMGTVNEGYYLTFIDNLREGFTKYGRQFYKITKDLTEHEKANFRRATSEIIGLIALSVLVKGLASIDGDDDDWATNFTSYQARRLQSELLTFNPALGVGEIWKIIKSPTATMSTIDKTVRLISQMTDPFEEFDRNTGYWEKGDLKLQKRIVDLLPALNGLSKATSPEDALKFFNLMTLK